MSGLGEIIKTADLVKNDSQIIHQNFMETIKSEQTKKTYSYELDAFISFSQLQKGSAFFNGKFLNNLRNVTIIHNIIFDIHEKFLPLNSYINNNLNISKINLIKILNNNQVDIFKFYFFSPSLTIQIILHSLIYENVFANF